MEQTILSKVNAPSLFFSFVYAFELLTELMQCLWLQPWAFGVSYIEEATQKLCSNQAGGVQSHHSEEPNLIFIFE